MTDDLNKENAAAPKRSRRAKTGGSRGGLVEESPRLRVHRQRRKQTIIRIAVSIVALFIIAGAAVAAYAAYTINAAQNDTTQEVRSDPKLQKVLEKPKPKKPFTILLLGADYRPGDTAYRCDTIVLTRVDPVKKKVWMISIPRDTKITIPGRGTMKINAANYGGPSEMISAVKELTGIPINYYARINFRGFVQMVDAIGGVWIDVPVAIDDYAASGASPGHRARYIKKGYQLLDGEHALTFVRARHQFVDQDFSRMKNQQLFFKALAKQTADTRNLLRVPRLVRYAAKYTSTNLPFKTMYDVAMAMRGIKEDDIEATTLKGEWQSPYIYPDEQWLSFIVGQFKNGGSFETSTGAAPSTLKPADISVSVRNGAGISGVGKEAANKLRTGGFAIGEVGNANQFVYKETLVIYKDQADAAKLVLNRLPTGRLVQSRGMYSFSSDVLVIVGRDWRIPTSTTTSNATQ